MFVIVDLWEKWQTFDDPNSIGIAIRSIMKAVSGVVLESTCVVFE